jgi:hypothetical protein
MRILMAGAALMFVFACSSGSKADKCVEGKTAECACPEGKKGVQTCDDKGAFGECKCDAPAAKAGETKSGTTTAGQPVAKGDTNDGTDSKDSAKSLAGACAVLAKHIKKLAGFEIEEKEISGECERDKWSDATQKCIMAANTIEAAAGCMENQASSKDTPKGKTGEPLVMVKKMYDGARMYYMDAGYSRGSITPLPPQFPAPSKGPTPPLGSCCTQGGKCAPEAMQWDDPVWISLMFSVDDPHYFSYSYITNDEFTEFTVRANGDLDCDGEYSTYEMYGVINSVYSDGPAGSAAVMRVRELE